MCALGVYVMLTHYCFMLFLTPLFLRIGLVEADPEGALEGFAEVVRMEPEKAEW